MYVNVCVAMSMLVPLFFSWLGSSVSTLCFTLDWVPLCLYSGLGSSVSFDIKHYILLEFDFSDMDQEEQQAGMDEEREGMHIYRCL